MGSPQPSAKLAATALMVLLALPAFAQQKQEFKYQLGPGGSVTIVNQSGPVTVRPASGRQVVVVATKQSDKIEIDEDKAGNRVQLRTHVLERQSGDAARVAYDVSVPAGVNLRILAGSGPISVEKVKGNVSLEGDSARVEVKDVSEAHLQVRTMSGAVVLTNVTGSDVEVASVGGDVELNQVSGQRVVANTTKGNIRYTGAFAGGGEYLLSNHSGSIDVALAPDASVDLTAHSVSGTVQNEYPLQKKQHTSVNPAEGRSFAGTSQQGEASVQLRSFSGRIRVKQQ